MQNIYLVKDLAKLSGHSTHAIKFYCRMGLIKEIGRSPSTNFRYFDDSSCKRLRRIEALKKKSLSLREIQRQLDEQD
jgi:DNA-binding transcriptional MerR regulator